MSLTRPPFADAVVRALRAAGLIAAATALVVGSSPRSQDAVEYVALGDSRAAAPDITVGPGFDGCGRSGHGYPIRVARALRPESFIDVSCAGATSANLVAAAQVTTGADGRVRRAAPQISALSERTTLVTLSIGGNDLRWWELVGPCFPARAGTDANCRSDQRVRERADGRLTDLAALIDADLGAVTARAPRARVFVVGHGGVFGLTGCGPAATLSTPDAAWVAEFFRRVDDVLRGGAHAHGATFVDVRTAAGGHESCAEPGQRWFAGNVVDGTTPVRHPTPLGGRAIAGLVLDAMR